MRIERDGRLQPVPWTEKVMGIAVAALVVSACLALILRLALWIFSAIQNA